MVFCLIGFSPRKYRTGYTRHHRAPTIFAGDICPAVSQCGCEDIPGEDGGIADLRQ